MYMHILQSIIQSKRLAHLWAQYTVHFQHDILEQTTFFAISVVREKAIGVQQVVRTWIRREWLAPILTIPGQILGSRL